MFDLEEIKGFLDIMAKLNKEEAQEDIIVHPGSINRRKK